MPDGHGRAFLLECQGRLLKSKDICQAFQDCLICIRKIIPADFMSLHLFDAGLGLFETVVDATPEASPAICKKTVLSPEIREVVRKSVQSADEMAPYLIIDCLRDFPVGKQLGMDLHTPDSACLVLRLTHDGRYIGSAALTPLDTNVRYSEQDAQLFALLHDAMALVALNFLNNRERERLKAILADRTSFLQQELMRGMSGGVVGAESGLKDVLVLCRQVAPMDTPVLLLGETGTGKEVIASAIHSLSKRHNAPFTKVNCGGIPPTLMDSTLFGHAKGAFTGANSDKKGYFERAEGGTLFLDEIGELPLESQTRFLHVLQDKTYERVGGSKTRTADVRVVAATNRNLEDMVAEGSFRQDLLFRLNVFPISIPPLRRRKGDIPPLADYFVQKIAADMGRPEVPSIQPGAVDHLYEYDWPGNIRELANVIEREIIIRGGSPLTFEGIVPVQTSRDAPGDMNLERAMADHIIRVLRLTKGRIEGREGAAELLGVNPRTLQSRMKKLGVPHGRSSKALYNT